MADEVTEAPVGETRTPDAEVKARELGWVPKEEFRGDPEKWVGAQEYLDYGEQVLPLVRATNARLKTDIETQRREAEATRRELAEAREEMKALSEYHAEELKQAHERARAKILGEIKEARREGDVDQEIELQGRLSKMDAEGPPKPAAPAKTNGSGNGAETRQPEVHPEVIAWQKENPWYGNDLARTSIAQGVAMMLRRDQPDLKGRAFLDEVVKGTNRELQKLGVSGQPARTDTKVEAGRGGSGGSTGGPGGGGRGYADLPSDAKAECDRWASDARLVGPNRQHKDAASFRKQWAAKYWEDN